MTHARGRTPARGRLALLALAFVAMALSFWLGPLTLGFQPYGTDIISYRFQARVFASGRLSLAPPPEIGLSPCNQLNVHDGRWYSKYAPGTALVLAPGEARDAPWALPLLGTGALVPLLFALLRRAYDARTAWMGAALAAVSPAVTGLGALCFSETVSRAFLGLFLWGVVATVQGARLAAPALAGLGLGWAFLTRPPTAVVFGVVGGAFVLFWMAREGGARDVVRRMLPFFAVFAVLAAALLAWNAHFTGDALQSTHAALQHHDGPGFGPRGRGFELDPADLPVYTPAIAVQRTLLHTLPGVSYVALGWGRYDADAMERLGELGIPTGRHWAMRLAGSLAGLLPLGLALLALVPRASGPSRFDGLFAALVAGSLGLYALFYFDGLRWNFTPMQARYHNEAIVLGLLPLVARGLLAAWDAARRRPWARRAFVATLALLLANTAWSHARIAAFYRDHNPTLQVLPRLVVERDLRNAVVFLPQSRDAPLGEYPFRPLEEADVVYFRLGPEPRWWLHRSDWRAVYRDYFRGRSAWLFEDGVLRALPAPDDGATD